jgi:flagellar basal body-associated protein FliL
VTEVIPEGETPQAAAGGSWALINLLLAILSVAVSIGLLITYFMAKKKNNRKKSLPKNDPKKKQGRTHQAQRIHESIECDSGDCGSHYILPYGRYDPADELG